MSQSSKEKCRTCLKESAETYPLTKHIKGSSNNITYLHILKEYAKLEYPLNNEDIMPQNICRLCSHKLKGLYKFIQQVQKNSELLMKTINKKFDCLKESIIDLPQEEAYPIYEDKIYSIKLESDNEEYKEFNDLNNDECSIDLESIGEELINLKNVLHKKEENIANIFNPSETSNPNLINVVLHNNTTAKNIDKAIKNETNLKCSKCEFMPKTLATLNYHYRSMHGTDEGKLKCKFCAKRYVQKRDMLWHVKRKHNDLIKNLKEQIGDNKKKSKPIQKADYTLNNTINGNFSCSDDDIIPDSNSTIEEDENEKELFSDEEFIRDILDMKKVENNKSLPRRCDECGQIYKNFRALYNHQRRVHISEEEYLTCPHCGKKFKRKSNLKQHINNVHTDKDPKNSKISKPKQKTHLCPECSHVCSTITALTIHRNRHHTGIKPYKCDFCPKAFVASYDLKIHRYLHTGERPFTCPVCSKGFQDKAHLVKHERMHVSVPPNQCDECGKRFTQRYNLLAHQRIHLKHKNLNCNICNKVFKNKSLLNLHRINENHQPEEANE